MSVRQTLFERCLSGLIILLLLVIATNIRCNAQDYDYTDPEPVPTLDATLESLETEGPELPTFPEAETETEPETLPEIEDVLETDLPSLEEDKPGEEETSPDIKVEATPGGDVETADTPVEHEVTDIDATAQAEPESDAPSETPAKPDATAAAAKPDVTKEAAELTALASTQPEPDDGSLPTTKPKDKKPKKPKKKSDKKKKKKKKKKKTPGKPKSVEPTTESEPTETQPIESQPTEPKPVEPETVDSKPVESTPEKPVEVPEEKAPEEKAPEEKAPEEKAPEEKAPEEIVPEEITPEEKAPEEKAPEEKVPEEKAPEEKVPEEKAPEEKVPEEKAPEEKVPEEKAPEEKVEKKPEEPVTQGPCVGIYTNAQKRQVCHGSWKDPVHILNLQLDKLTNDKDKLWLQVTEIHGKIKYSRSIIHESHISSNTWKKRVAYPDATSDEDVNIKDCNDAGQEKPGVYLLNVEGSPYTIRAFCVKGWTVVQRRFDGSEDFDRDFDDYLAGFGNFSGEFFLGLENLHRLTKDNAYTLRIDAKGSTGKWYYGVYEDFSLSDELDGYRISLGNMTAGNYLDGFENARSKQFSTRDRDNDDWRGGNCAEHYGGGWWSSTCSTNLNQMWCRSGCMRWAAKHVVSSIIRIKPSSDISEEDLSENPNPGGLTLDNTPA